MKIFSGLSGLVILVLVLCFSLSNQQDITLAMWPFSATLQAPLYLIGLAPLAFGLAFGALWGWLSAWPHRLRARRLNKEVGMLTDKIGELQKTAINEPLPTLRKHIFWRRNS